MSTIQKIITQWFRTAPARYLDRFHYLIIRHNLYDSSGMRIILTFRSTSLNQSQSLFEYFHRNWNEWEIDEILVLRSRYHVCIPARNDALVGCQIWIFFLFLKKFSSDVFVSRNNRIKCDNCNVSCSKRWTQKNGIRNLFIMIIICIRKHDIGYGMILIVLAIFPYSSLFEL